MPIPIPQDETVRLSLLEELAILDSPIEDEFEQITRLVATYFDISIAFISLIAKNRQWFKSQIGLGTRELPRELSFCTYAIMQDEPLIVPDTLKDSRFAENEFVINPPHLRFYAAAQITHPNPATGEDVNIGTVAITSDQYQELTEGQIAMLQQFADLVSKLIRTRYDHLSSETATQWVSICSWCRNVDPESPVMSELTELLSRYYKVTHGMCDDCVDMFTDTIA